MSRSTSPPTILLISPIFSPVSKRISGSVSRLLYGSPQRRAGICKPIQISNQSLFEPPRRQEAPRTPLALLGVLAVIYLVYAHRCRGSKATEGFNPAPPVPGILFVVRLAHSLIAL